MPRVKVDAFPDRIDARDWFYRPALVPLPPVMDHRSLVPLPILNQGNEGACTGYALAAVINYLLKNQGVKRQVSPRMLYEMARHYDEWPGDNYEGSSARGAMKGWVAHGVCPDNAWPKQSARGKKVKKNKKSTRDLQGPGHLEPEVAKLAKGTPGGAYYRVQHREVRDMHAALAEVGILSVTLMVHDGWDNPSGKYVLAHRVEGKQRTIRLPIIKRSGRADDGHAVAIVGYTPDGFIIQNSWGDAWGLGGFALLPYEDYVLHATDVWVAQLGVPVCMDLWKTNDNADQTAGMQRASHDIPLADIRPYVVDVGNNGELSRSGAYWTTKEDVARLFTEQIRDKTKKWKKKRVLFYLHGGLNDEKAVARRVIAFRDVMLENEIYPVHLMWESGLGESLSGIVKDYFTDVDERAGSVRDWWNKVREGLTEAKDRTFEMTLGGAGGALWREMKENAKLASHHPYVDADGDSRGGIQLLVKYAKAALAGLAPAERAAWELHVVGHSAGSIVAAYAMDQLAQAGATLKTVQFMAPAITMALFKELLLGGIRAGRFPLPTLYLLDDPAERDDTVGPYGKSLLYLVSNACEDTRERPLLGMLVFIDGDASRRIAGDHDLRTLYAPANGGPPTLVIAGVTRGVGSESKSRSHGGFDNDVDTMNSVLRRVLGGEPARAFNSRDLQF